jgi:hypothetical protein
LIKEYVWTKVYQSLDESDSNWNITFQGDADQYNVQHHKCYLHTTIKWKGDIRSSYHNDTGRSDIYFLAQIVDHIGNLITELEEFDTVSDMCLYVRKILIDNAKQEIEQEEEPNIAVSPLGKQNYVWKCPECDMTTNWSVEDSHTRGQPVCPDCDIDMEPLK